MTAVLPPLSLSHNAGCSAADTPLIIIVAAAAYRWGVAQSVHNDHKRRTNLLQHTVRHELDEGVVCNVAVIPHLHAGTGTKHHHSQRMKCVGRL